MFLTKNIDILPLRAIYTYFHRTATTKIQGNFINDICSDIVICLYLFSNIKITPNLVFSICSLYHIKNIITRF